MMTPPPHRHSRSRNLWMEGLSTAGMGNNFAKIALIILLLIGVLLVSQTQALKKSELKLHQIHVLNDAYQAGFGSDLQDLVMVPIKEGNKILLIENFALKAGGLTPLLQQIKAGNTLDVWVDAVGDSLMLESEGGRRVAIILLSKNGKDLISENAYNKALGNNGHTGWWVIAMALSMVPYFFIARPRVQPIWILLAMVAGMIAWFMFSR